MEMYKVKVLVDAFAIVEMEAATENEAVRLVQELIDGGEPPFDMDDLVYYGNTATTID